eukprot:scaffold91137_cov19-Prasinocladus_malaysianus.AAC.1
MSHIIIVRRYLASAAARAPRPPSNVCAEDCHLDIFTRQVAIESYLLIHGNAQLSRRSLDADRSIIYAMHGDEAQ